MTRLTFPGYLDHLRADSARFRTLLTDCDPAARVPACPDWDAADLLWHLAHVQLFWATVVTTRPAGPPQDWPPARPSSYADLLAAFDGSSAALATALERADPEEEAWHWADEHTVATSYRRQAHEALIHRLDAEQTVAQHGGQHGGQHGAQDSSIDPALAADGVAELLEVMYGGPVPDWGRFDPAQGVVKVSLNDAAVDLWVQPGLFIGTDPESGRNQDGPHLVLLDAPPGAADTVIEGRAADVDAWLWHRRDDAGISRSGDDVTLASFLAAVTPPLD